MNVQQLISDYDWRNLLGLAVAFLTGLFSLTALLLSRRPEQRVQRSLASMGLLVAFSAAACSFAAMRFLYAGKWCPPAPDEVGDWQVIETPIPPGILEMLGGPQATGREYRNHFGEVIYYTAVSAGPFENYHDPTVCVAGNGWTLTAKRTVFLPTRDGLGGTKVRAMIFKRGDYRILMYYWTQSRHGVTATEARMGNYRDILARLQTGYGAVIRGDQTVIIRNYALIPPEDTMGMQTQRNLDEISQATYETLRADGLRSWRSQ